MASNDGNNRPKGRCCVGALCKHPNGELCASHKCLHCKKIVHILCGSIDPATDKIICDICSSKTPAQAPAAVAAAGVPTPPRIQNVTALNMLAPNSFAPQPPWPTTKLPPAVECQKVTENSKESQQGKKEKSLVRKCPACGGIDHQRRI